MVTMNNHSRSREYQWSLRVILDSWVTTLDYDTSTVRMTRSLEAGVCHWSLEEAGVSMSLSVPVLITILIENP